MLNIARLPPNDRRDLFRAAAQQMRVNEAIVEKDFWVCWTLDYLLHESPWQDKLAFKGGTSLSKAYGVIERFSEDTAVPGTLKLLPPDHNRAALAADYKAMAAMLFGEIPSFDDILTRLSDLEAALNALPRPVIVKQPSDAT